MYFSNFNFWLLLVLSQMFHVTKKYLRSETKFSDSLMKQNVLCRIWSDTSFGSSSPCWCFSSCSSFYFYLLNFLFFSPMQARPRTLMGKWQRDETFPVVSTSYLCVCAGSCQYAAQRLFGSKSDADFTQNCPDSSIQSRNCTVTCMDQISAETRRYFLFESLSC